MWLQTIMNTLSIGSPYCADVIINNSAQHSSNKILWSLDETWLNDGTDFAHFTARNNNLAADSKTASLSAYATNVFRTLAGISCKCISSELETSSSLATSVLLPGNVVVDDDDGGLSADKCVDEYLLKISGSFLLANVGKLWEVTGIGSDVVLDIVAVDTDGIARLGAKVFGTPINVFGGVKTLPERKWNESKKLVDRDPMVG